jgi:hypothetical protein
MRRICSDSHMHRHAGEGTCSDAGNVVGASAKPAKGAHQTFIEVEELQQPLCGQSRPHFFRGVATVRVFLPRNVSLISLCNLTFYHAARHLHRASLALDSAALKYS